MFWYPDSCNCEIEFNEQKGWLADAKFIKKCKAHATPAAAYNACKAMNTDPKYVTLGAEKLAADKAALKESTK